MALWTDGDNMTPKRRNRESLPIRLLTPVFDINQGGTVTASAKPVDGDDIVTSETTHYTVGASVTVAIVHSLTITNTDTVTNQASVHLIPSGGSRQVANTIWDGDLPAGDTVVIRGPWFLDPSDTIRSISSGASANEVALRAEVIEFTGHPDGGTCIVDDGDALTVSDATYYTCPASNVQHAHLVAITICNTDSSARTVEVAIIPSGQTVSGRYRVFAGTVQAGETIVLGEPDQPYVLEPGDFVQAKASAGSVVGFRITPVEYATS